MSLFSTRKRSYITEMAKNAQRRVYDKLTQEKQQLYLTAKVINELITNTTQSDQAKTLLKKTILANRFDWDNYVELIKDKLDMDINTVGWYEFSRKFKESPYNKLYTRIYRTVERKKDDIDRNYYDRGINFHNSLKRKNKTLNQAYAEFHMDDFIEWFNNNEAEAKDRFGVNNYNQIKRDLARWIMPDYHGSLIELQDEWNDWIRKWQGDESTAESERALLDETLAYKLALVIQELPEDVLRIFADNHPEFIENRLKYAIVKALGSFPSIEECRAFLSSDASQNKERIKAIIDNEIPETIDIPRRDGDDFKLKVKEIVNKYFVDNPRLIRNGGIVTDAIGSASVEIVRGICQYALTRLNTRYKTDTDKPFVAHNLQEFYDTYKPVFKLGLTKECLETLFENFAKEFKENA